jgi:hypothetical protein
MVKFKVYTQNLDFECFVEVNQSNEEYINSFECCLYNIIPVELRKIIMKYVDIEFGFAENKIVSRLIEHNDVRDAIECAITSTYIAKNQILYIHYLRFKAKNMNTTNAYYISPFLLLESYENYLYKLMKKIKKGKKEFEEYFDGYYKKCRDENIVHF